METLVHAVVLVGVVVVMPLVFRGIRRWSLVGLAVMVSFLIPVGAAAAVVASTWLAVALWTALSTWTALATRTELSRRTELATTIGLDEAGTRVAAAAFGLVAAAAFVQSRAGLSLFGIGEPIVELTAVHFTYAGVGAVTLAGAVAVGRVGRCALVATAAALPIVAVGFVTAHPLAQVGGAVLLSVGVLVTATLQLRRAVAGGPALQRALLVVSGLAPWVPMGLAVAWAASLHWEVPALSIPDMARTHGVMNVVFVVAGLLARRGDIEHTARAPARSLQMNRSPHVHGAPS